MSEESGLYDAGARRWLRLPTLPTCPRGAVVRLAPEGRSYREQVWCGELGTWINPNGHSCRLCRENRRRPAWKTTTMGCGYAGSVVGRRLRRCCGEEWEEERRECRKLGRVVALVECAACGVSGA